MDVHQQPEALTTITLNAQQATDIRDALGNSTWAFTGHDEETRSEAYLAAERQITMMFEFNALIKKSFAILALILCVGLCAHAQTASLTLPSDTEVELRFAQTIWSGDAHVGDRIALTVERDVKVGSVIVIPEGATAHGTITLAKPKRWAGRAGQLGWSIDSVTLPSGQVVLLNGSMDRKAEGHGTAVTAGVTASVLILPIAAPFVLMVHGHNFTVPQGTEFPAYVDHDTVITGAK